MKIACQTILWGRKIEYFENVVSMLAKAGFEGIEIAQRLDEQGGIPNAHDTCKILKKHNLELVGLGGGTLPERIQFAAVAKDYFPSVYLYVEKWELENPETIAMAVEQNIRLAAHPHIFRSPQNLDEAEDFLNENESLLCVPDTAHLTIVRDDFRSLFEKLPMERVPAIHLKDWVAEYGRASHNYAKGFIELGQGACQLKGFLDFLKEKQYSGWLVFEQDNSKLDIQNCLKENAKWLVKQGFELNPDAIEVSTQGFLEKNSKNNLVPEEKKAAFLSKLINASTKGYGVFVGEAAQAFVELADCNFASIWSPIAGKNLMNLAAIYPSPDESCRYQPTLKINEGLTQDTLNSQTIKCFNIGKSKFYKRSKNQIFMQKMGLHSMVSLPVLNPYSQNHPLYVVNIFDQKWRDRKSEVLQEYFDIAQMFSIVAGKVLNDSCELAAGKVDLIGPQPMEMSNYVNRLRDVIRGTIQCEAVSIFIINNSATCLELATDAPVDWCSKNKFYQKGKGVIGKAWEHNRIILVHSLANYEHKHELDTVSREIVISQERHECLVVPISNPSGIVLGVVRCVNKVKDSSRVASAMFSDDDAALLESMLQAAAPQVGQLVTQRKHRQAMGHMASSITDSAAIIESALNAKNGNRIEIVTAQAASKHIQGIITHEILVHTFPGDVPKDAVHTFCSLHDVIVAKAKELCDISFLKHRRQNLIHCEPAPNVRVVEHLFVQMFFELFRNAIKYGKDNQAPNIRVDTYRGINDGLLITISDYGKGFSQERKKIAFQGVGLGLCRSIAQFHDCTIDLSDKSDATIFEIWLPPGRFEYLQ